MLHRAFWQDPTRVDLSRFGPDRSEARHVRRLPQILQAFLEGYNRTVVAEQLTAVGQQLDRIEPFFRGFADEGAGMGFAARCLVRGEAPGGFERLITALGAGSLFQYYVGLGWWLARWYGLRYAAYSQWLRHLDHRYRPIVFDGVGFHAAFFDDQRALADPRFSLLGPVAERVRAQGYGRAHWFIQQGNAAALRAFADRLTGELRGDFLSGVGLAAAYSAIDTPDVALSLAGRFAHADQPALWQGIAFGWEARSRQDPVYFQACMRCAPDHERLVASGLAAVADGYQRAFREPAGEFYLSWVANTRANLTEVPVPGEEG